MGQRLLRIVWVVLGAWAVSGCGAGSSLRDAGPTPTLAPWSTATPTPRPPTPRPTEAATIEAGPSPTPFKHIVQPNQTILEIALLYGVTEQGLRSVNPELGFGDLLRVGQELLIPDSEGNPIGSLIPSPTPIPLAIQPPVCYPQPSLTTWCLTAVRNGSDQTLENLAVEIRAVDSQGKTLQAIEVYPPLNFLPGGGLMPLGIAFDGLPPNSWGPAASVRSAIPANELEARYRQPRLTRSTDVPQAGGASWQVGGTLTIPEDAPAINRTLVLATAFDAADQVVGFAVWEPPDGVFPGESAPFELRVFTLGPPIARVDLTAETYALARPRE